MNESLVFQLELKLDEANQKIDQLLNNATPKAQNAGKEAGSAFGSSFQAVISAYLSAISFNGLISQIKGAVGAYQELTKSNLALNNVITAYNKVTQDNDKIVKSSTATYEEKAAALGYTADQMYKTVSASKSSEQATRSLEREERNLTRAKEDLNNQYNQAINLKQKELDAIKKETDEKIRQLKGPDYEQLQQKRDAYDLQISSLKQQKDQVELNGGNAFYLDNQIAKLQTQKDLNDQSITQIDIQTNALQRQSKTREDILNQELQNLRTQLSDKVNVLDIDIEKAKRKLEDFKATFSGGGTVKQVNPDVQKAIERAQSSAPKNIDQNLLSSMLTSSDNKDSLYNKYGRIVSRGTINAAASNLIQGGLKDENAIKNLIDRYINEQAQAKGENIRQDQAILNLSESFKTGNSAIGNLSGQPQNYKQIDESGVEAFNKLNKTTFTNIDQMTEADKATARYLGTLEKTQGAAKGMANALVYNADGTVNMTESIKKGVVANDIYDSQIRKLTQDIGGDLAPAFYEILSVLVPIIKQFADFVKNNPELVKVVTEIAVGFTGILTAATGLWGIIKVLAPFFEEVILPVFEALTGPIGLIVLGIAALAAGLIWAYQNVGWFRDGVNDMVKKVKDYIEDFKNHWQERIGEIIGFFITLPIKLPLLIADAVGAIYDYMKGVDWKKFWDGLGDGLKAAWDGIVHFFQNIDWKGIGDGFKKFFRGLIEGMLKGIPGVNSDEVLKNIGLYAKGGWFDRPTMGIFGEAGPEAILNMNAISALRLTPESVKALNAGGNSVSNTSTINSNNSQITNNYGIQSGPSFIPGFQFA